MRLMLILSYAY